MFKNYQFFIPRIEPKKKKRIPEIDFVRGICIILMIFDHFFYDFAYLIVSVFGFNEFTCPYQWLIDLHNSAVFYRTWDFRASFRYGVLAMFLISSGFSTNFSRNNLKRGYFITIVGAFFSIGSYMLSYMLNANFYMTFGTILAIGSCILIYAIYLKVMQKFDKNNVYTKYISMIIGLIIIFIGYFGINYFANDTYDVSEMSFLNFLGSVIGSLHVKQDIDWLSLFPYLGFMFFAGGLGSIIYKDKISIFTQINNYIKTKTNTLKYKNNKEMQSFSNNTDNKNNEVMLDSSNNKNSSKKSNKILNYLLLPFKYFIKGVCYVGKYPLIIYVVHQVLIIIFVLILMLSLGYSFSI